MSNKMTKEIIDRIFKAPGVKYELSEFDALGKPIHEILSIEARTAETGRDAGKTKYFLKSVVPFASGKEDVQVYVEGGKSAPEEIVRLAGRPDICCMPWSGVFPQVITTSVSCASSSTPPSIWGIDFETRAAKTALKHAKDKAAREERDVLFIERVLKMLKPGGRAAIVLPQGKFNNSSRAFIREWILKKARLLAVVDLHPNTFKPHTGTELQIRYGDILMNGTGRGTLGLLDQAKTRVEKLIEEAAA